MMMNCRTLLLGLVGVLLWLGGCGSDSVPERLAGPSVVVDVAALNLQGVGDVVWDVEVVNGADPARVVWQKRVASSGYGDGAGSASYVGPCDADPAASENTVKVWVVGVYSAPVSTVGTFAGGAAGGATGDAIAFDNPTSPGDPLEKTVTCSPNSDAKVRFDVSLARPAEQGFFDVAVSFEDIFCSAKLDCEDDQGGDLDLLHDATGARNMTAVFGFACTASLTGSTYLYMDDPYILCDGQAPLEVKVDANGQGTVDFGQAPSANPGGYLFAASVYRGVEGLAHKAYWNISFGLDEARFGALGTCRLIGRATASKTAFPQEPEGFPLPEGAVYPVIDWSVELSHGGETPGRSCSQHEVNVDGSGVATSYLGYLAAPNAFSWATDVIYLDNRFELATGIVLKKTGFSCNPGCAHGSCSGVDTCDCTDTGYAGATCATPVCTTPCANGGVCMAPETCDCTGTGYEGASCGIDVDECATDNGGCDPNATCTNSIGSFSCACGAGYGGDGVSCSDTDGCAGSPCAAGVGCTDVPAPGTGYTCGACPFGQWGDGETCTDCAVVAGCGGTLSCSSASDSVCSACTTGFEQLTAGADCTDIDECATNNGGCDPNATCANSAGSFSCACGAGYEGDGTSCADIDGCAETPCAVGVTCTDVPAPGTGFGCGACPFGQWGDGETCTDCAVVAGCGGTLSCSSASDSVCSPCTTGFEQLTAGADCTDIDECATDNGGCDALATCTNTAGARTCGACPAGYAGDGESGCDDIDECTLDTDDCDPNATCTNSIGSFSCACGAGYSGDGASCSDTDGCAGSPCAAGVGCTDVPAPGTGYTCGACPFGQWGDGETCTDCAVVAGCAGTVGCTNASDSVCSTCDSGFEQLTAGADCTDIDECATDNGGCDLLTACTNTPGARTCDACPAGYTGDGETGCDDIDECATDNGGCDALTTCTNTAGARTCGACPAGYTGDGESACDDIDECTLDTDDCDPNATCTNSIGSFSCACGTGYSGDGVSCSDTDGCAGSPCAAGVTCTDVSAPGTGFTCGACPTGQWGDGETCTPCTAVEYCEGALSCTTAGNSVCATCTAGYAQLVAGADCTDLDECALETDNCSAFANCANTAGGYSCACQPGHYGDGATCTACPLGEVQPDPGHASCVSCGAGTYDDGTESCASCSSCPAAEYVSSACTATGDTVCTSCAAIETCSSGLTCTNASDSQCSNCAPGYAEPDCANIDDCSPDPCLNGGVCADGVDSYTCSCVNGYTGTDCDAAPVPAAFGCSGAVCSSPTTGEVWVPAGDFWMGCNAVLDTTCNTNEDAQHLVTLSAYAIDETEVTAARYKECVQSGPCGLPSTTGGTYGTYDPVSKQDHPINYVTWDQAAAYCAWSGKAPGEQRLCTEAEWERAARGGCELVTGDCAAQMRRFPWGAATPTCALTNFYPGSYCESQTYTSPVGTHPGGVSPYGAQDMAGSVWEWVADWYDPGFAAGAVTDPTGPTSGTTRILRGGGFGTVTNDLRTSARYDSPASGGSDARGFRCCRSTCSADADCGSGEVCTGAGACTTCAALVTYADAATWEGKTSSFTFHDADGDGLAHDITPGTGVDSAIRMTTTFAVGSERVFGWTVGGQGHEGFGLYEAAEDATFDQDRGIGAMNEMTKSWGYTHGNGFDQLFHGGNMFTGPAVTVGDHVVFRVATDGTVTFEVNGAVAYTFPVAATGALRWVVSCGNNLSGHQLLDVYTKDSSVEACGCTADVDCAGGDVCVTATGACQAPANFVAVADDGHVMTSTDGLDWAVVTTAPSAYWQGIAYGDGTWVATSARYASPDAPRVMTSPDGLNWTSRSVPGMETIHWGRVRYGNGHFVTLLYDGTYDAAVSDDGGATWVRVDVPAPDMYNWVLPMYGANGVWVIYGGRALAVSTDDAATWSVVSTNVNVWLAGTYGVGRFVVIPQTGGSSGSDIGYSDDGQTWSWVSNPHHGDWTDVAYGLGKYIAVGTPGGFLSSATGESWTYTTISGGGAYSGIAYRDGRFVAVSVLSGASIVSTDGVTWTPQTVPNYRWTDMAEAP